MAHQILINPLVTEKSLRGVQDGKYTFAVSRNATKLGVEQLIRAAYSVDVIAVNITKLPSKPKQRGTRSGVVKAVVTLAHGQSIKGFELPIESKDHDHQPTPEASTDAKALADKPVGKRNDKSDKGKAE